MFRHLNKLHIFLPEYDILCTLALATERKILHGGREEDKIVVASPLCFPAGIVWFDISLVGFVVYVCMGGISEHQELLVILV